MLAISHPGTLQNLDHILLLREKETRAGVLNAQTQKVKKSAKVPHREFLLKGTNGTP